MASVSLAAVPKATKPPVPARAPPAANRNAKVLQGPASARASTLLPAQDTPDSAAAPPVSGKVAIDELDLSKGTLTIAADVAASVKDDGELDVKVRLPGLAQGDLKLRQRGGRFSTPREQGILLAHPALGRFGAANPTVLVLRVKDDLVTGWIGLGQPGPVKGGASTLFHAMAKGGELLGWAGLSHIAISAFHNKFENGVIDVGAERIAFTVGGFLSGNGSAALDNKVFSFDGMTKIQIPGGSTGELQIRKDPAGVLAGKLDIQANIGSVAGTVTATLTQGFVSIMGSVAYTGDRLNGKVTLVATDEATARDITLKKPAAGGDVPIELPGPDKPVKAGKRAFCGYGQVAFRVTDWLTGTATVIVNNKGQATIIGEIAPPREFILFEQKEWIKKIFKVEIRAGYGIPVVGQVALFANISLDALAKIGPGKLYNIKLAGAYSTDPRVTKQLSIEGTINISAFAGLRARAEAGLVVTILAHDIKAGVGLNAIAGVRGYVEATPRIGMRELAPGKPQYYIQGHMEIAAQPILGFSGDLFVEIETPWWSPLSDKRWTWPLFSLEYPLPGEFGVGADVDYVLGSKQWPKIEFGEVNFDSSKFLTDVMNDNADSGGGGEEKKQGDWNEGLGGGGPGGAKNKGGAGKRPGEPGYDSEPVGESLSFSDGHESHQLWFEEKPGDATLMVASTKSPVTAALKQIDQKIELLVKNERPKAQALKAKAVALLPSLDTEADQVAAMKEAERKAEEMYRKYGKKKGKSKGKKASRKDKNKKLKTDERKLKELLVGLYTMLVAIPFKPVDRKAALHGGTEAVSVAKEKDHAGLRVANRQGFQEFVLILASSAPLVRYSVGKVGAAKAKKAQGEIDRENEKIKEIPIKHGQMLVRYKTKLEETADRASDAVSGFGMPMHIHRLQRARQFLPLNLGPKGMIKFVADPAKVGAGLYRRQFLKNMREQLRDQERGIRLMSVDQWLAQRALFTMDEKAFRALDTAGRKEVMAELSKRAERANNTAIRTTGLLEKWIEETADKAKLSDDDYIKMQKWWDQLFRAEQRKSAAEEALLEIERASKGRFKAPDSEILKARYENSTERMRTRIVGRQDEEKKVRDRHKKNLKAFLKRQGDWSELAKIGSHLAILHRPDQVAGGFDAFEDLKVPPGKVDDNDPQWIEYFAALRKMFGPAKVNSLIGTQWKGQIETLAGHMKKAAEAPMAYPIHQVNLTLRIVPKDS
jgi:hypothetical protein